jgi:hypothetical protein
MDRSETPSCKPPGYVLCTVDSGCKCTVEAITVPEPPKPCQMLIKYENNDPNTVTFVYDGSACDAAGIELALAILLAKMLGAR